MNSYDLLKATVYGLYQSVSCPVSACEIKGIWDWTVLGTQHLTLNLCQYGSTLPSKWIRDGDAVDRVRPAIAGEPALHCWQDITEKLSFICVVIGKHQWLQRLQQRVVSTTVQVFYCDWFQLRDTGITRKWRRSCCNIWIPTTSK